MAATVATTAMPAAMSTAVAAAVATSAMTTAAMTTTHSAHIPRGRGNAVVSLIDVEAVEVDAVRHHRAQGHAYQVAFGRFDDRAGYAAVVVEPGAEIPGGNGGAVRHHRRPVHAGREGGCVGTLVGKCSSIFSHLELSSSQAALITIRPPP